MSRRLLLIGWDGADPAAVHPLLDEGAVPHLNALVERGSLGTLAPGRPLVRAMNWTTVATGVHSPQHGVCGDRQVRADGAGVARTGHSAWRAPAFWEHLQAAGHASAVIGWPASAPASGWHAAALVDDRYAEADGPDFDAWALPPDCIAPTSLREDLRELRVHPRDIAGEELLALLPRATQVDQDQDPILAHMAVVLARTATVHAAATYFAERDDWRCLAVVYPLLADLQRLLSTTPDVPGGAQAVRARAYGFQDLMLGRMLDLAGPDTTVLLVSPYAAAVRAPQGEDIDASPPPRSEGFIAAAGPGLHGDALLHGASVADVAPTVLAMFGLRDPSMDGRPLEPLFAEPAQAVPVPGPSASAETKHEISDAPTEADPPLTSAQAQAVAHTTLAWLANRAEAHLARSDYGPAARAYERILAQRPADLLAKARLAQCRLYLGDHARCRNLAHELIQQAPEAPWGHLLAGTAVALQGEHDTAQQHLERAYEHGRDAPNVLLRLGAHHLLLQRWQEAETMFRTVLTQSAGIPQAHDGLGCALHGQGRHAEAERAVRTALGMAYHQPLAHLHLAMILADMQRWQESAQALDTALAQNPNVPGGVRLRRRLEKQLSKS